MINELEKNIELKNALKIIWLISILLFLVLVFIILFFPQDQVLSNVPLCIAKQKGSTCILCGSTRAFLEIGNLNIKVAYQYNKFSIFIFITLLVNFILYLTHLFKVKK